MKRLCQYFKKYFHSQSQKGNLSSFIHLQSLLLQVKKLLLLFNRKCFFTNGGFLNSDIIVYLENYAIGETPHVSIRRAVDEAKKILADLKRRNHRHADIAAR